MSTKRILQFLLLGGLIMACQKEVKQSTTSLASDAGKVGTMDAVTLSSTNSTQTTIDVTVTAGLTTGAPAGFTLQWMKAADLLAYSGSLDNTGWPEDTTVFCKGSFSGNAYLSNYNLAPGASVTVNIGDLLLDNGASTNCPDALDCGTEYVFRAFAHATRDYFRSDWSATLTAATDDCNKNCAHGYGFWRNHCTNKFPQSVKDNGLMLGTVHYTADEICAILNQPPAGGNGLIILAHSLITTKLNEANGAIPNDQATLDAAIAAADGLIGNLVVPPVGGGFLGAQNTAQIKALVAGMRPFNEGGGNGSTCE